MPDLSLARDAHGRLMLTLEGGTSFDGLTALRCFPLSAPERHIALVDAQGRERWHVDDLATLPEATRRLVVDELSRREFLPVVRRIVSIQPRSEPSTWEVETDRGTTTFTLASEDQVRRLSDGALVTDVHGVRYRIEEVAGLDAGSQGLLRRYF
ncbi:MAG: hypothetical protein RL199_1175 [Pseudomonadota bacterium]|jgi:hypothetical protein